MQLKDNTKRTEERRNRFNGESVMLTKEEARRHDNIFINELAATLEDKELGYGGSKKWDNVRADLDWFRNKQCRGLYGPIGLAFLTTRGPPGHV